MFWRGFFRVAGICCVASATGYETQSIPVANTTPYNSLYRLNSTALPIAAIRQVAQTTRS